jgi:hypothetical protein
VSRTGRWTNDRTRDFASRPWTQADNDKLRRLALTGLSSRAIRTRMNRTETAVCSRARQLGIIKVTMAGEVVDTYEGSGDLNTCSRYGAVAGGLKGY